MTPAALLRAVPALTPGRAALWAPCLDEAMRLFDIDTPARIADFFAQVAHESGDFLLLSETWGPTPAQQTYERDRATSWGPGLVRGDRNYKAWGLGNEQHGDGFRYRGHGPLQITGRRNHAAVRDALRAIPRMENVPDFEAYPDALCQPRWGVLAAAHYWHAHGLSRFADAQDFIGETEAINGGQTGLANRLARRIVARAALGV